MFVLFTQHHYLERRLYLHMAPVYTTRTLSDGSPCVLSGSRFPVASWMYVTTCEPARSVFGLFGGQDRVGKDGVGL